MNLVLLAEAAADPRIPYSTYWLRTLVKTGRVKGHLKSRRWFVDFDSLLVYVEEMSRLGPKKHGS